MMCRSAARSMERAFEVADTPKHLLDCLNMITAPALTSAITAAGTAEVLHARRVRTVFEDPNIVAVGISEKMTSDKSTGELSVCFYVEKKVGIRKLREGKLVPPVMSAPNGKSVFTDVKAIGRVRPEVDKKVNTAAKRLKGAPESLSAANVAPGKFVRVIAGDYKEV